MKKASPMFFILFITACTITSPINYGDTDGDGKVSIRDAIKTARYSAGLTAESVDSKAANVDGDSKVSITDALLIARFSAGLIKQFPFNDNSPKLNRVTVNGKKLFISGMNVAWDRFAMDVGDTPVDKNKFKEIIEKIRDAGGNAIRWWLSTNCAFDPKFGRDGLVSGLGSQTIANVKTLLDLAEKNGVVISLCLLSFDMMQSAQYMINIKNNEKILTTEEGLNAYINNALIPLVSAMGNHPAILCWEIFNEPEGMAGDLAGPPHWKGWATESRRITFKDILRVVNRTAGAIHRAVPGVNVSNGSAGVEFSTEAGSFVNSYTDENLIAAGGDADGILDFYMFHFYPQYAGDDKSPFHNPAAHWKLDKPLIIGEFPAGGITPVEEKFSPSSELTSVEAFNYLYDNGYAGGMSWSYTGFDERDYNDDAAAMKSLYNKHKEDIWLKDTERIINGGNGVMKITATDLGTDLKTIELNNIAMDLSANRTLSVDLYLNSLTAAGGFQIRLVTKSGSDWRWTQVDNVGKITSANKGKWITYTAKLADLSLSKNPGTHAVLSDIKAIIFQYGSISGSTSGEVYFDNIRVDDSPISDFNDGYGLWGTTAAALEIEPYFIK